MIETFIRAAAEEAFERLLRATHIDYPLANAALQVARWPLRWHMKGHA